MWKTFFLSPMAGGIAAILGWTGAVLFRDSMSAAEFANLRFGWTGVMVGGVAIGAVIVLIAASDLVEPLVMAASAAFGAWMLWNQTELPFATNNFDDAGDNYWYTVTMAIVIFVLLLVGLRAARESTYRAKG